MGGCGRCCCGKGFDGGGGFAFGFPNDQLFLHFGDGFGFTFGRDGGHRLVAVFGFDGEHGGRGFFDAADGGVDDAAFVVGAVFDQDAAVRFFAFDGEHEGFFSGRNGFGNDDNQRLGTILGSGDGYGKRFFFDRLTHDVRGGEADFVGGIVNIQVLLDFGGRRNIAFFTVLTAVALIVAFAAVALVVALALAAFVAFRCIVIGGLHALFRYAVHCFGQGFFRTDFRLFAVAFVAVVVAAAFAALRLLARTGFVFRRRYGGECLDFEVFGFRGGVALVLAVAAAAVVFGVAGFVFRRLIVRCFVFKVRHFAHFYLAAVVPIVAARVLAAVVCAAVAGIAVAVVAV